MSEVAVGDFADDQAPRCTRTRRSIVEHDDESARHYNHFMARLAEKKFRFGKPKPSKAQKRRLFEDGANPDDYDGLKLDSRERGQIKLLRKQRRDERRQARSMEPQFA